jgi:flagellar biosynthesis protein FlhA
VQYLSNVLYPVGAVIANLVRERAPLAERSADMLSRLIEIVREDDTFDVVSMTLRLREHISSDLCRTFTDSSNQLFVLLLDQADEQWLVNKLRRTPIKVFFDRITPEEAKRLIRAVQERFEEVARGDHARPVIVCDDWLRAPLFDMVHRFDPRIFVLSYTELSPDVRLTSRGVIRQFTEGASAS